MRQNKVLGLLGLATRAGRAVSGEFAAEKAVKTGKAALVIVSAEASENTKTMFRNLCAHYQVPCYEFGGKEELGRAMGKELRASLAVTDPGFAEAIGKLFGSAPDGRRSAAETGRKRAEEKADPGEGRRAEAESTDAGVRTNQEGQDRKDRIGKTG